MKNIFILEDEECLLSLYKERLESNWFVVEASSNFDDSFKVLKSFKPDLCLIDHWIKWLWNNWIDLIPFIKEKYPNSISVVLSNYDDFQIGDKAIKSWAFSCLLKMDYSPKKIVEYIDSLKV